MSKINIHAELKTSEKSYDYILPAIYHEDDKTIIYKEKDDQNTTMKFDYKNKILYRENDSLRMIYKFKKNETSQGEIFVKGMNRNFFIKLKTLNIKENDINIDIRFLVENENFNYKIEVL